MLRLNALRVITIISFVCGHALLGLKFTRPDTVHFRYRIYSSGFMLVPRHILAVSKNCLTYLILPGIQAHSGFHTESFIETHYQSYIKFSLQNILWYIHSLFYLSKYFLHP